MTPRSGREFNPSARGQTEGTCPTAPIVNLRGKVMDGFFLTLIISFGVIFVAELGDKSQLMALTFASRFRPLPVLIGVTIATSSVHLISVAVGHGLGVSTTPGWTSLAAATAFFGFGVWTLHGDSLSEEDEARARRSVRSVIIAVSTAFFLAELGDKTMLATITLSAQNGWFGVWLGSTAGMVVADALAIWIGMRMGRHLDARVIQLGASALFFGFALWLTDRAMSELTGSSILDRLAVPFEGRVASLVASVLGVLALTAVWITRRHALGRGLWPRGRAVPGSVVWWARVLFGAAALLGILAPIAVLTGAVEPIDLDLLAEPGLVTIGAALLLLGVSVVLIAQVQVGAARRAETSGRSPLATRGVFSRTRNPGFTGMAIANGGMLLMVPTVLSVLSTILMLAAARVHVRGVREPALIRKQGELFVEYSDRVGRFLPRIR